MTLHWKKYVAEAIGTAALTCAVLTTLQLSTALATPVAAALTVAVFVYTIGAISGAHLNPAVTLGLVSIKKISPPDALAYIIAQLIGALGISFMFQSGLPLPALTADATVPVFIAEAKGAAVLLFGIGAVVHKKVSDGAAGVVIGGSLLLGITIASLFSNGILNPTVAIAIGSISWAYLLGPIVGAIVSCHVYRWLVKN